jgi:galactose-1-phosphate uridylyltransferase
MFNLVIKWIKIKHKENKRLKYPTLLWDFLQKGGASQIHPHSKIYFYIILYE